MYLGLCVVVERGVVDRMYAESGYSSIYHGESHEGSVICVLVFGM